MDQDKARFAPVVWKYPATSGDFPKIIYGQKTSNPDGGFTIDIEQYNFNEPPTFVGTIVGSVIGFVFGSTSNKVAMYGSCHDKGGYPIQATFNYIIIGK